MFKFLAAPLAAAATFTLFALPALAENNTDTAVKTVTVGSLSPVGQTSLRHDIAVAAHQVCDKVTEGAPAFSAGYQDCVSQAVAGATAQLTAKLAAANDGALVASAH